MTSPGKAMRLSVPIWPGSWIFWAWTSSGWRGVWSPRRRGQPVSRDPLGFRDSAGFDDERPVVPDGRSIRRLRHDRGWSRRDLCRAIARASLRASGIASSLTPNQIAGVEEHGESIPYTQLCMIAAGLDCNPVDLLGN